jgi:acyl dehydratase
LKKTCRSGPAFANGSTGRIHKSELRAHCGVVRPRNTGVLLRFTPCTASRKSNFWTRPPSFSNRFTNFKKLTMKTFQTIAELAALAGQEIGYSDWLTVTQEQVNQFAQATGDHQWIHVDVERAKAGPFGAPIAHGFLTLSLLPKFFAMTFDVVQKGMGVNYGLNKVRFTSPVPVGSRLRAKLQLLKAEPIDNNGLQMTWAVAVEREGVAKPVCIAESMSRSYP